MNNLALLVSILVFTVVCLLFIITSSAEYMYEMPNKRPKKKYHIMDIDTKRDVKSEEQGFRTTSGKELCIETCRNTNNCNMAQYYHSDHPIEKNRDKCRMVAMVDDTVSWVPASGPMTTIVLRDKW